MLELTQAKADGSYHKQLKQLASIQLLVIDDWGLEPLKPAHRNDLMEIMDDRHGHTSTLVISQLPTDQWYASIGDIGRRHPGSAHAQRPPSPAQGGIHAQNPRPVHRR